MSVEDEARALELVRYRPEPGVPMGRWRVIEFPAVLAVDELFRQEYLGGEGPVYEDHLGRLHVDVENGHHVYVRVDTRLMSGRAVSYWRMGY